MASQTGISVSNPWYAFVPRAGVLPNHAKTFLVNGGQIFVWAGRAGDENQMADQASEIGLEVVSFEGRPFLNLTGVQEAAQKYPDAGSVEAISVSQSFEKTAAPLLKALKKMPFKEIAKRVSPNCDAFLADVKPWGPN